MQTAVDVERDDTVDIKEIDDIEDRGDDGGGGEQKGSRNEADDCDK